MKLRYRRLDSSSIIQKKKEKLFVGKIKRKNNGFFSHYKKITCILFYVGGTS